MSMKPTKQRTVALRRLLSRLWYRRDAPRWTIHGHDQHRRAVRVHVGFSDHGVTLDVSRSGPLVLAPLQAGRLRGAIRDAITAIDQPGAAVHCVTQAPIAGPPRTPTPTPRPRKRLVLDDHETRPIHPVWPDSAGRKPVNEQNRHADSALVVVNAPVARSAPNHAKEGFGGVG